MDTSSGGFELKAEANSANNERGTVTAIQVIEKVFYVATSTTAPHAAANDLVSTDISDADSDVTGEFLQFSMSIVAPRCEVLLILSVFLFASALLSPHCGGTLSQAISHPVSFSSRHQDVYHTCFDCASDPLDLAGTFGLTCDW